MTPPDYLIACAGIRVDSRCAEAMERLALCLPYLSVRFVDNTWLAPSELATASLFWLVDVEVPADQLREALQVGLPLLLPGQRHDLKALCNPGRCYTYETAGEAAERIASILGDTARRIKLSERVRPTLALAAKHATAGDR